MLDESLIDTSYFKFELELWILVFLEGKPLWLFMDKFEMRKAFILELFSVIRLF